MAEFRSVIDYRELAVHFAQSACKIVDASTHLPGSGRDARQEYLDAHIPGATFFDVDKVCDPTSDLPHMMPDEARFAAEMSAMGISNSDQVIVYDDSDVRSSARLWWMLRAFGHKKVAVLDGGLEVWKKNGGSLASGEECQQTARFEARLDNSFFCDWQTVLAASSSGDSQIIDARSEGRFRGEATEPRAGVRSGHIPGSGNLPFGRLYNADGLMKNPDEIRAAFDESGLDFSAPVITTCGSGVTACVLALAMERVGKHDVTVYDGSWTEWGGRQDLPIETGDPA